MFFISLLGILFLVGCKNRITEKRMRLVVTESQKRVDAISKTLNAQAVVPPLTIWIHGTRLGPKNLFPNFFYSPPGLVKALSIDPVYHIRKIADTLASIAPCLFPLETFYLFGWAGHLDSRVRLAAAQQLAQQLAVVINEYQKHYKTLPKIRIFGHSHGGNIALLLAQYREFFPENIKITELILLATPIQEIPAACATNDFFETIHNFYSTMDTIQVLDMQCLQPKGKFFKGPFFSDRLLSYRLNCFQTQLKFNNRGLMHIEFIFPRFLKFIPYLLALNHHWHGSDKKLLFRKRLLHLKIKT